MNLAKIYLLVLFLLCLQGCLGHLDGSVMVPEMELQIDYLNNDPVQNNQNLVVAYAKELGEVDAVLYIIKNRFSRPMFFDWREIDLDNKATFKINYEKESRNKGTLLIIIPIPTSDTPFKSRIIFFKFNNIDKIFRVSVVGKEGKVEFSDITSIEKFAKQLSGDYKKFVEEKKFNPDYWAKDKFYKKIKWNKTEKLRIVQVNRTEDLDLIRIRAEF